MLQKRAENTRCLRKEKPWFIQVVFLFLLLFFSSLSLTGATFLLRSNYIQTFLNTFMFASMVICFHMARFSTNTMIRFLLTTASWEAWLMSSQSVNFVLWKAWISHWFVKASSFQDHRCNHFERKQTTLYGSHLLYEKDNNESCACKLVYSGVGWWIICNFTMT